jgi:hypothetical protein
MIYQAPVSQLLLTILMAVLEQAEVLRRDDVNQLIHHNFNSLKNFIHHLSCDLRRATQSFGSFLF